MSCRSTGRASSEGASSSVQNRRTPQRSRRLSKRSSVPWSRPPHSPSIRLPVPRSKAFQIQSFRGFFDEVPDLVALDHRRAAPRRLGLGTLGLRVIPTPAQHALRRDPDAFGHRVHRQAQAIKLDRVPLHRHRLAARRSARELPAAARALALPTLPAAGMAGPDQHRPAADRAGFRALVHHTSTVHARQRLSKGASVTSVKPSNFLPAPSAYKAILLARRAYKAILLVLLR